MRLCVCDDDDGSQGYNQRKTTITAIVVYRPNQSTIGEIEISTPFARFVVELQRYESQKQNTPSPTIGF